ncbi:MAG TPA: flagellar hook capping FlgD N-terminal domain-containing protein [Chthoniobacterales bacterium]|jgi:flagellar basal-body rod modification protein FlgD|nr:flagellar hook capping FlgD N-terminal domain-containing protein [Chthoniobacterales bacterium]
MNIPSINNTSGSQAAFAAVTAPSDSTGTGFSTLGVNDFLKLITVQLQNQDPLKPMDDTQFVSQMASFTNLQQTQTLTADFEAYSQQASISSANGMLGGYVTVADAAFGTVTGQVTSVKIENGTPKLLINGVPYDLSAVQSVSITPPVALPVTSDSAPQG